MQMRSEAREAQKKGHGEVLKPLFSPEKNEIGSYLPSDDTGKANSSETALVPISAAVVPAAPTATLTPPKKPSQSAPATSSNIKQLFSDKYKSEMKSAMRRSRNNLIIEMKPFRKLKNQKALHQELKRGKK
jgi:hypothetical protein